MEAPAFFLEDLLDLPNGDDVMADEIFDSSAAGNSTDSSTPTAVDSCNSSVSGGAADTNFSSDFPSRSFADAQFSGELCVPYDDMAQLEWLSNFMEESFSSEDLHKLHLVNGPGPAQQQPHRHHNHHSSSAILRPDGSVSGKARSKLSQVVPSDCSTRLLTAPAAAGALSKKAAKKRVESSQSLSNGEVRRCLHCEAEKTPQWRTGPMGPKTLCNACGVRYKSGRLVQEYRPASSPTFVSTKHSNSHRKVLELRRQKDLQRHHQFLGHGGAGDDYMIHHHVGPEFRQLI